MTYPTTPSYLYTFSVPTPFPVGPVNLYLAEGEPLTLLDAGPRYDPARKALTEALAERGYRVADLQRLILTHAHPDHCGLAAELVRESGAEVMAHAETDLICLYQPQRRLLLSGDHLLRDISSNPLVEPPAPGQTERPRRLVEYMAQLRRVAEMDIALTLPGHGPPITDHRALIRERLAFHEKRARHILETMGDEALTTHEIVSQLFSGLDPINHFLAISEVIGHLQWLEVEGRVTRREQGGVARWRGKTRY
ncbi:MAG: hypothetical protein B6I35_10555 [Anaerolineaceae bacterium 4572_32.2]|nr:MAG: hypothetical protein B6I35_10555 [Anaerolineaceae bacterium 4572_32.2]